jgi:hypothetical protein
MAAAFDNAFTTNAFSNHYCTGQERDESYVKHLYVGKFTLIAEAS